MKNSTSRAALVATLVALAACADADLKQRQTEVAVAGSAVMPFDLESTTHVFEKIEQGGLQTVVADADDAEQVSLIREHLSEEAERFARGDFHDPAMIHGHDMPGLHELVMGHEQLEVDYREVPRGAEIRYTSEDSVLVTAVHEWFEAQLNDHGTHAQSHR